jgi:hypothetical protein
MNTHISTRRRPLVLTHPVGLRLSRPTAKGVRAWLNQPARHEPVPGTAHMYGLLLRPTDRPDIGGSR